MIELVVYIVVIGLIFEMLQLLYPYTKLAPFIKSLFSIFVLYLICLKFKAFIDGWVFQ